jgi:hypothetical protein
MDMATRRILIFPGFFAGGGMNGYGQVSMVMRLLKHKFGEISPDVEARIKRLSSPQLEDLSEALLDFEQVEDLTAWFSILPDSN